LADKPSISIREPSERTKPAAGASGRAPTLVAMTISSPMPRLRAAPEQFLALAALGAVHQKA